MSFRRTKFQVGSLYKVGRERNIHAIHSDDDMCGGQKFIVLERIRRKILAFGTCGYIVFSNGKIFQIYNYGIDTFNAAAKM